MPMSRLCTGRSVMSRPATWTRPESGSSKPAIMRSDVVLPQPDRAQQGEELAGGDVERDPVDGQHAAVEGFRHIVELMVAEVMRAQCHPEAEGRGTFPGP